jgi:hypothetical protein
MKVKFSCVADQHPRFGRQAFIWAASLLTYGGAEADSLVIHTVGEYRGEYRSTFDDWGIETRVVTAFDLRHPPSNKLTQLESEVLHSADYVVLCDCDLAFSGDVIKWIAGASIRARIANSHGLKAEAWRTVLKAASLPEPDLSVQAIVTGAHTLAGYVNGGFYVVPQLHFQHLREVWPRWNRWLLDNQHLIAPHTPFTDQISFAISCHELGLTIDHLPLELNLDTVYLPPTDRVDLRKVIFPLVLHYHRLNRQGFVQPTQIPAIDRQVRKVNDLIKLAEQVNYHKPSLMLLKERPITS